jgi:hypothetical protein
MSSGHIAPPTIAPVRMPGAAELADFAREAAVLRRAWRLADWQSAAARAAAKRQGGPA